MEDSYVYFKISPNHTNYVNRILEGYEYLGVMRPLIAQKVFVWYEAHLIRHRWCVKF